MGNTNIISQAPTVVWSATALAGNATITSVTFTGMLTSARLSIQYRMNGAGNVTLAVLAGGMDAAGPTLIIPDTGGIIVAGLVDNGNWHLADILMPLTDKLQLQAISHNATAVTMDAIIRWQ